MLRKKNVHNNR